MLRPARRGPLRAARRSAIVRRVFMLGLPRGGGWRRRARRTARARSGSRSATAARWRATVASSPRAIGPVRARSAPSAAQLATLASTSATSGSRSTPAVAARRSARPFERDEEVRGDRGGGVVGGAVGVGDVHRAHAERGGELFGDGERARRGARDGRGRAGERRALRRDRHERMQREGLVVAERGERRGGRAVADEPALADGERGGGGLDLRRRARRAARRGASCGRRLAAPERALDIDCGGAQRAGQRRAHAAGADDRDAIEGARLGRQRKLGLRGHRVGPVLQEVPVALLMCERLAPPRHSE